MENHRLKLIFLFILFSAVCFFRSNAQIVYTDVNPDLTQICSHVWAHGTTYFCSSADSIDLNNDGIKDFSVSLNLDMRRYQFCSGFGCGIGYKIAHVYCSALNNNMVRGDSAGYPLNMHANDFIKSGNFINGSNLNLRSVYAYTNSVYSGIWNSTTDGYLGLQLISGGQTFYGWARLFVSITITMPNTASVKYTIRDYAYNSIPGQTIRAGETSCTTPTVSLTKSGPLSFCAGDSVTLTANGTGYLYQWKKGGVNIVGATSKSYTAKTAGYYKCKVTNSCGSLVSPGKTVTVNCRTSDLYDTESLEHLSVYPNPATNNVTIKFPSDEPGEITIVNLYGQVVFSEMTNAEQVIIDVSRFSTGIYMIRWRNDQNAELIRFSITK